jgi:glutathione synthase/RimK-type ligase-like ATP-grasp enzyme
MANIMNDISILNLAEQIGTLLINGPSALDDKEKLLDKLRSKELSSKEIDTLFDEHIS